MPLAALNSHGSASSSSGATMTSRSVSASLTAARSRASDSDWVAQAISRLRSSASSTLRRLGVHRANGALRPADRLAVDIAAQRRPSQCSQPMPGAKRRSPPCSARAARRCRGRWHGTHEPRCRRDDDAQDRGRSPCRPCRRELKPRPEPGAKGPLGLNGGQADGVRRLNKHVVGDVAMISPAALTAPPGS